MGFHHRSTGGLFSSVTIVLLLELLVWRSPSFSLSSAFFCYGRKVPSHLSSSSALWKPAATTPSLLGTRSNRNRITANQAHRSSKHPTGTCLGYYIPFPSISDSSRNSLFSKNRQIETDDGADDEGVEGGEEDEKSIGYNNDKQKGALSFLGNVQYGVNCVHKDFLRLSWNVYSRTFLGMVPFVVLLFLILPACSSSSSPSLRLLATKVQGFLKWTFEILAEGSSVCFGSPIYALENWIGSWWTSGSTTPSRSAWKSRNNVVLRGLLWGPIVEELLFRLAFRSVWKILFRPICIGSNSSRSSSSGKDRNYGEPDKTSTAKPGESLLVAPSTFLVKRLLDRRPTRQIPKPKLRYTNRSWRIASGICFAVAHFSNNFPILLNRYTFEGEIQLPSGTMQERFLLGCFPGDFASRPENKEFCLVSMILAGTVYQAMHCFINTMVLYGPLLDDSKSRRGGILAAIGAHIAWNANVIYLATNLKVRLLCKLRLLWKLDFLSFFSATKTKVTRRPVRRGELF